MADGLTYSQSLFFSAVTEMGSVRPGHALCAAVLRIAATFAGIEIILSPGGPVGFTVFLFACLLFPVFVAAAP